MATKEEITLHSVFELKNFTFTQSDEVNVAQIDKYFDVEYPAHIYFIVSRQRISFDKDKTTINTDNAELGFKIQKKDKYFPEFIKVKFPDFTLDTGHKIESEFPFTSFSVSDKDGIIRIDGKAAHFANEYSEQISDKEFLDCEILYIGESTAKKDSAPVIHRTGKAHDALQKILTDYTLKHIDKEVFFFFLSFKHNLLLDFPENPTNREYMIKNVGEYQFGGDVAKKIKQRTALLEWLLVYYFKPEYNGKLKENPPTLKNSSFDLISKMNLTKCTICMDLDVPLVYTQHVKKMREYIIEHDFK